jgi:hypothetical protein
MWGCRILVDLDLGVGLGVLVGLGPEQAVWHQVTHARPKATVQAAV